MKFLIREDTVSDKKYMWFDWNLNSLQITHKVRIFSCNRKNVVCKKQGVKTFIVRNCTVEGMKVAVLTMTITV